VVHFGKHERQGQRQAFWCVAIVWLALRDVCWLPSQLLRLLRNLVRSVLYCLQSKGMRRVHEGYALALC
jgi:hypothetical protein